MKIYLLISFCLIGSLVSHAQPGNDDCLNADELCSGIVLSGTVTNATTDGFSDHNFCTFVPANTVWYAFTTNTTGGMVTIDFTNLIFNPDITMGQQIQAIIYDVGTACDASTYTVYSACGTSSTNFSVIPAVALSPSTTYYVQVNGQNSGAGVTQPAQCTYDITISGPAVDVILPTASISALTTVICLGDDEAVTYIVNNCPDSSSYVWYYNNDSLTTGELSTSIFTESGYLKLIVNCSGTGSCIYSDTTDSIFFDVTIVSADAGPDKYIVAGDQVMLDGSGDGTPLWSPSSSLTDPNVFTPIATPGSTTTYYLTVTNDNCTATDMVNVFVGEVIIIYSAFSPNGDDINDKWIITNSGQFPNMEVRIYDRSGQQVYQTVGYTTQDKWWDGTMNNNGNRKLPASAYYYVIDLNDPNIEESIFKGVVSIIR